MGIFRKLGRQVEQLTQTATEAAAENADYQCRTCDERFHTHHDRCPECGAQTVVVATEQ